MRLACLVSLRIDVECGVYGAKLRTAQAAEDVQLFPVDDRARREDIVADVHALDGSEDQIAGVGAGADGDDAVEYAFEGDLCLLDAGSLYDGRRHERDADLACLVRIGRQGRGVERLGRVWWLPAVAV